MKVLVAVDSITTLDILINEMSTRSWRSGTEARGLSIIEDGDVPLKVRGDEGYGLSALRRAMDRRGKQKLNLEKLPLVGGVLKSLNMHQMGTIKDPILWPSRKYSYFLFLNDLITSRS